MGKLKKVLILGSPGSGKSYYAKKIGELTGLTVVHLDNLYWKKDKSNITFEELEVEIDKVIINDRWIIDGNYRITLEQRLKVADTIIYLDFTTMQCIKGVENRIGIPNDNMPWVEEEFEPEFKEYILTFRENIKPKIIEILNRYTDKDIYYFKDRSEIDAFIDKIKRFS